MVCQIIGNYHTKCAPLLLLLLYRFASLNFNDQYFKIAVLRKLPTVLQNYFSFVILFSILPVYYDLLIKH